MNKTLLLFSLILLVVILFEVFYLGSQTRFIEQNPSLLEKQNTKISNEAYEEWQKVRKTPLMVNASWISYLQKRGAVRYASIETEYSAEVNYIEKKQKDVVETVNGYLTTYQYKLSTILPDKSKFSFFYTAKDIDKVSVFQGLVPNKENQINFTDLKKGDKLIIKQKSSFFDNRASPIVEIFVVN